MQADVALERMATTVNDQPSLTIAGMHITEKQDMLNIDHDFYLNKIEQTPYEADLNTTSSMRMG